MDKIDHECVGKIQLSVYETITYDETTHMKVISTQSLFIDEICVIVTQW